MFAYAAPAPPSGGLAWQDVQLADESGDAAAWHVWQTGPTFVEGAISSWQVTQPGGYVAPWNVVEVVS
jgi:hypothetical protein